MSSQPSGAAAAAPEKEWHCPLCTALNSPKLTRCPKCSYDCVEKKLIETPVASTAKIKVTQVSAPDEGGPVDARWVLGVAAVAALVAIPGVAFRVIQTRNTTKAVSTIIKDAREEQKEFRARVAAAKAEEEKEMAEARKKAQLARFQADAAAAAKKSTGSTP
jgi:hypothetical protein